MQSFLEKLNHSVFGSMSRMALTRIVITSLLMLVSGATLPLLLSLLPSTEKESPTLTIDLSKIPVDSFIEVEWKNKPVVIFRPGPKAISGLISLNGRALPPISSAKEVPPAYVYERLSTFKGCGLRQTGAGILGDIWPGGWIDPCHFGAWDYSGRWVAGASGNTQLPNLAVPEFRYTEGGKNIELMTKGSALIGKI